MKTTKRHNYYALAKSPFYSGGYIELLVVREDGKQVSQEATGKTYRTWSEACADNEAKNAKLVVA